GHFVQKLRGVWVAAPRRGQPVWHPLLDILSRSGGVGYRWLLPGEASRPGADFWAFCPEVAERGTGGCCPARAAGQEPTSGHFVQKFRGGVQVAAARQGQLARDQLLDILSRS